MEFPPKIVLLSDEEVIRATSEAQEREEKRKKNEERENLREKCISDTRMIKSWNKTLDDDWLHDATIEELQHHHENIRLKELEFLKDYWTLFPDVPEKDRPERENGRTKIEMMAEGLMLKINAEILRKKKQQEKEEAEKERKHIAEAENRAKKEAEQKITTSREEQVRSTQAIIEQLRLDKQKEIDEIKKQLHESEKNIIAKAEEKAKKEVEQILAASKEEQLRSAKEKFDQLQLEKQKEIDAIKNQLKESERKRIAETRETAQKEAESKLTAAQKEQHRNAETKLAELQVTKQKEIDTIQTQLQNETRKLSEALKSLEALQKDVHECTSSKTNDSQAMEELKQQIEKTEKLKEDLQMEKEIMQRQNTLITTKLHQELSKQEKLAGNIEKANKELELINQDKEEILEELNRLKLEHQAENEYHNFQFQLHEQLIEELKNHASVFPKRVPRSIREPMPSTSSDWHYEEESEDEIDVVDAPADSSSTTLDEINRLQKNVLTFIYEVTEDFLQNETFPNLEKKKKDIHSAQEKYLAEYQKLSQGDGVTLSENQSLTKQKDKTKAKADEAEADLQIEMDFRSAGLPSAKEQAKEDVTKAALYQRAKDRLNQKPDLNKTTKNLMTQIKNMIKAVKDMTDFDFLEESNRTQLMKRREFFAEQITLYNQRFELLDLKIITTTELEELRGEKTDLNNAVENLKERIDAAVAKVDQQINAPPPAPPPSPTVPSPRQTRSTLNKPIIEFKLDKINLPIFSGDLTEWSSWKEMFLILVHDNEQLTDLLKLHQLRSHLKGAALDTIRGYQLAENNYIPAWENLKTRYERKNNIIHEYIKKFIEVPILNTHSPYQRIQAVINGTNQMLRALPGLGVNVVHWDPFILFVLLSKLDEDTRREWKNKIGKREEVSVEEFLEFLEVKAIEGQPSMTEHMYNMLSGRVISSRAPADSSKRNQRRIFQINSPSTSNPVSNEKKKTSTRKCPLPKCDGPHNLFFCPKFKKMKPMERKKEVENLRLCFKCFQPHFMKDCASRNCPRCNGLHNSLLCFPKNNQWNASKKDEDWNTPASKN